jgi:hypothetical protein
VPGDVLDDPEVDQREPRRSSPFQLVDRGAPGLRVELGRWRDGRDVAAGHDPHPGRVARVERAVLVQVRHVVLGVTGGREAVQPEDALAHDVDIPSGTAASSPQSGSNASPYSRRAEASSLDGSTRCGCGSPSFAVTVSAPSGFTVSVPSSTITLNSASTGYVWAYVTSPATAADGDYPLTATVERAGSSSSAASSYKVYSSDTVAPKLYWTNPSDGGALSGRSAYVGFASSDDHAVKRLDLYVDGVSKASRLCDSVAYECQVSYKWSIRRVRGQHTAT